VAEFEKLLAADPTNRELRTELVTAYIAMKRVGDSERVLTAALKKNGRDVDALLQRSRIYLESGKLVEAQADLNQVLHFRSTSAEAHYLLAKVGQAREDSASQKQELGQALRVDPNYLAARIELAQLLLVDRGALPSLQLLDETPKDQAVAAEVVLQRNRALLALGQKTEARKGIDQVLATAKVPEALVQDAALKLQQKDYTGARASAEEALKANPEEVAALKVLMATYSAQKLVPIGVQKVRDYAMRQPASAPVLQFLGELLTAVGDSAGARQAYEAAKAAKPGMLFPDLALAELDTNEGRGEEARKRLSAAISSHPRSVPALVFFAQLEVKQGRTAAAIEQYRKALAVDDKNIFVLNGLAYQLAESGQADEALKYAQIAKQVAPDNPAVEDTLGWIYFRKNLYDLAVTHLESATAKEGTALRKYHLAMAYLKAGDAKRGRQTFESALRMNPNLPEAQVSRQLLASTPN
jgi:tetratricopeptide (TPR) repeat protein